ncbi:sialate O-acetylesterase [Thiofilum flexile]|uniref:sialate O-acetylesterase n=1 Tax=Thiofilum flexile TaxID=125627 RepID=UPI000DA1A2C2|nr:sialate O-acetylesterase [Thiofilum flexile]
MSNLYTTPLTSSVQPSTPIISRQSSTHTTNTNFLTAFNTHPQLMTQLMTLLLNRLLAQINQPTPAPTPAPTPTTTPATKVIDIYLLGGQSNAGGLGAPRLEKALETELGADTAQHEIKVFKSTQGGTNLYAQWKADGTNDSRADGSVYRSFQKDLNSYLAEVKKDNPNADIRIAGMFWHQGESDALSPLVNQNAYGENLTRFIKDVRATTGVADLPFIIGRLSDKQQMMSAASIDRIQAGQDAAAAADPRAVAVPLEEAQVSGIHFTGKGYNTMASLLAQAYKANFT